MFVDSHAHLYSEQFDEDRSEMLQRARAAGIEKVFLPNIDLTSVKVMHELEDGSKGFCVSMMGLHPCSVKENYKEVLAELKIWFGKRQYAAIGEIGIDLFWDKTTLGIQIKAFRTQLEWAFEYRLPVSIHSRDSTREILDVLSANKKILTGGVMHCFSGSLKEAEEAITLGFYLGFGGSCTYKNTTLIPVIESIPLDKMVLETDAPYLTPVPHRGQRNESAYIPLVAERIATIKNITIEKVAKITTANVLDLFKNPAIPVPS